MTRSILTPLFVAAAARSPPRAAAAVPDFDRDVRPIIAEHCLECHSLDKAKGGLALVSPRRTRMKKLKSGAITIVPGNPDASELVKRVVTTDRGRRDAAQGQDAAHTRPDRNAQAMGRQRRRLARALGLPPHHQAPSTGHPASGIQHPESHRPLRPREAEAETKLTPSPEADRITLIRRVWYDLLGLPPTPEEVDAFVNDKSANAYERMVDTALASPHYGERWGRHWLDMARYADSDGYEKDRPRPDAWRYPRLGHQCRQRGHALR